MSTEDIVLYGTLLLFIGGPTTIGAGLAIRLAIRGGAHLARTILASSAAGVVATTAAFIYMSAPGGGENGRVDGLPGIPATALTAEELNLNFVELRDTLYYKFEKSLLEPADAERLLLEAVKIGKVRKLRVTDTIRHTGGEILRLRDAAQNYGLEFVVDEN